MGSEMRDSAVFLAKGNSAQFEFVFNLYPQALGLKSQSKNKKPEELKKLDQWYHDVLPKKIQSRAKEGGYLTHEELVQTIKWKLARGKWRPKLRELVTMNTPRLVQLETKKAIRQLLKKDDVHAAVQAMCNLKGVGPAMASAVLSVAQPEKIPFMSDECLMALPDTEGTIDYTNKEYMRMCNHVQAACQRLSDEGHSEWTAHKIEQVIFAHHVIATNKPELLEGMPGYTANGGANGEKAVENGAAAVKEPAADIKSNGESPLGSAESSRDGAASTSAAELDDNTNDSIPSTEASSGIAPCEDSNMGDESNQSAGDGSAPASDDGIMSAADDSVSMPPPAAPEGDAETATSAESPASNGDAAAAETKAAKRPAEAEDDADAAKRAKTADTEKAGDQGDTGAKEVTGE